MTSLPPTAGRTPPPGAKVVEELDVDELPSGRIHRLWLDLMDDELGQPILLPLIVARGSRPGPVFGITAAVHGNELNGIPVIHEVMRGVDLKALRGTVVTVPIVNVPGFRLYQRPLHEGTDLNTIFPGRGKGNTAQVYAFRVMQRLVRRLDRLLDLHTASFGRINSLYARADMDDPVARRMAYLLRPQIILHNRASDRTLRGTAMGLNIPAVTLEIGDPQRFQPKFIKSAAQGARRLLEDAKMLPKRKVNLGPLPILCEKSRWLYAGRGGLLTVGPGLCDRVRKGEVIATLKDVFGDVVAEYRAPMDAVVIGKSVNPAGATGARIAHLGVVAGETRWPPRDEQEARD